MLSNNSVATSAAATAGTGGITAYSKSYGIDMWVSQVLRVRVRVSMSSQICWSLQMQVRLKDRFKESSSLQHPYRIKIR